MSGASALAAAQRQSPIKITGQPAGTSPASATGSVAPAAPAAASVLAGVTAAPSCAAASSGTAPAGLSTTAKPGLKLTLYLEIVGVHFGSMLHLSMRSYNMYM